MYILLVKENMKMKCHFGCHSILYVYILFTFINIKINYRLLTNDLFAKGLKKAFDVTAFGVFAGFILMIQ